MRIDTSLPNLLMALGALIIVNNVLLSIAIGKLDRLIKLTAVLAIKADYIEGRKAAGIED